MSLFCTACGCSYGDRPDGDVCGDLSGWSRIPCAGILREGPYDESVVRLQRTARARDNEARFLVQATEIGFCSKYHIIRQDDKFGPVTPCACFVEHHDRECRLRIAVRSPIAIDCEEHRKDSCLTCFSCTCGVAAERMFVCGKARFSWEPDVGLIAQTDGQPAGSPP